MSGVCRLCGGLKQEKDLVCNLGDIEIEAEKLVLRAYIAFYCRVELEVGEGRSNKVCRTCRSILETFVSFSNNLNWLENSGPGLIKSSATPGIGHQSPVVNSENIKTEPLATPVKQEPDMSYSRTSTSKTSIRNIIELFKDDINKSFEELVDYSHITCELDSVEKNGEISSEWLDSFKVAVWKDFVYKCVHCRGRYQSLKELLKHMKEDHHKFKIGCAEADCKKTFSALNSYINHVVKYHHEHLAFCCIECSKIHYNVPSLIKHYEQGHSNISNIYPCIDCCYFAPNITQLKVHLMTHTIQEVLDSDEEPEQMEVQNTAVSSETEKKPEVNKDIQMTVRNFHPKAFKGKIPPGGSSGRKEYPCDLCNKILLTYQGFKYHKRVHANIKPFPCSQCDKQFRSKQGRDEHQMKIHS